MLLELRNVSKVFGGVRALQSVSFDVAPGEVLCLAGENGCGKSTLIKIISGVYRPEPGAEMLFDGKPMDGLTPGVARSLGIQVIWQDLALFPEMTVAENIAFERNLGGRAPVGRYGRGGAAGVGGRGGGARGAGAGGGWVAPRHRSKQPGGLPSDRKKKDRRSSLRPD